MSSGQSTYVVLNPNEKKTIKISSFSSAAPSFFVSPKPSLLILDEDDLEVNEECNFDGICQEGENSSNCRDDCKPVGLFIGYVVFIVVLFLVVFVGVSIWYQRHKEEILFGDRKQLFNLVNFIDSARDKGVKDPEIVKALTEKGWVKERIDYAMQKSRSVDKISFSSFNNFIDKKIYANSAVTQTRQQAGQKINKPGFQGRSRKR